MDFKLKMIDMQAGGTGKNVELKMTGVEMRPERILNMVFDFMTEGRGKPIPAADPFRQVHPLANKYPYVEMKGGIVATPEDIEAIKKVIEGNLLGGDTKEEPTDVTNAHALDAWRYATEGWKVGASEYEYEVVDYENMAQQEYPVDVPADELTDHIIETPAETETGIKSHFDDLRDKGLLTGPSLASRFPKDYETAVVESRELSDAGVPGNGIKFDSEGHPMFQTRYVCTCGKRSKRFVYNKSTHCRSHCCNTRLKIEYASNKNLRDVDGHFYKAVKVYTG